MLPSQVLKGGDGGLHRSNELPGGFLGPEVVASQKEVLDVEPVHRRQAELLDGVGAKLQGLDSLDHRRLRKSTAMRATEAFNLGLMRMNSRPMNTPSRARFGKGMIWP